MRSLSSQVGWTKGELERHTQQPRDDGTHVQRGLATAAHGTGETEDLDMGCRYGGQTGGASHDDSEWKRDTYRAHLQCAIFPKSKLGRSVVLRTTHHVLGVGWTGRGERWALRAKGADGRPRRAIGPRSLGGNGRGRRRRTRGSAGGSSCNRDACDGQPAGAAKGS